MEKIKVQYIIKSILPGLFILLAASVSAQVQTRVIGDSVYLHSNTGTAELILENSTKDVNGFLYNKGNGRTEFRNGLVKVDDSTYVFGSDTLRLDAFNSNWKLTGNADTDSANHFLGTLDSNRLVLKTNNQQRLSVWADGTVNIAANDTTSRPLFRIYPNGDFTASATNEYITDQYEKKNGVRFNKKLGILEVGISNNIDTSLNVSQGTYETSGLILNTDNPNTINSPMISSLIAGDGTIVAANAPLNWTIVAGEQHRLNGGVNKSIINGHGNIVTHHLNSSIYSGLSNRLDSSTYFSIISGNNNLGLDTIYSTLVNGASNKFSGRNQFLSGENLISQSWSSTTLGSSNVVFTSLPTVKITKPVSLYGYPIFSIGNGTQSTIRSNAVTVLYNGRTQINTTGYDSSLVEADVTPKAALEVVSKNSGILIPRLTNDERDSIANDDLHDGLLLYNTDSSQFQFYNGAEWKGLGSGTAINHAVQTLTDSSTIVWDAADGINGSVTLGGTDRELSIDNPVAGQTYRVKIVQDGTGSRTISDWPEGTLWPSGTRPVLSTAPSAIDLVSLYYDGTNYFGDYKLLYKPIGAGVSVHSYDARNNGTSATVHSLTNVPAGALLVLTTSAGSSVLDANITSSPSLTWTKQVEASTYNSGDAEIYTAVFTAGGNITVTSDWGNQGQASVCYVIVNQESSLGGATAFGTLQLQPSVSLTTTRANSLVIAVTSDWNAISTSKTYRGSPTETQYSYISGAGTFYHYYREAPTAASYTMGLTAPTGQSSGTAVIEIRGN